MSILKIIMSLQVFVANEILAIDKVSSIKSGDESIEKCGKLSKTGKLFKSQKLAKSRKKLSKSWNLSNFDTKKNVSSFLTFNARTVFNYL